MLMLALTKDNEIIHIKDAVVKTDYYCDECGGILRVKNGTRKVKHFFHKDKDCGSEGESLIHRYWKNYFVNLKEFEGYKIVASKAEVPLLSGSYIPDVFLKNDKGTYIIIEIFYKNPKTDDYQKFFKILGDKGIEKVYEVQVDYEKILDIKTLFDREKNREIEKKKEELTENLIKKIERKRQYILEKYSKNGGLIFNIINDILCNYKDLNTKIKSKDTYNKFTDIENMINSSLKCKKFKICLVENLEFENEKILIESTPFYINIYDYRNFIDYLKRNGELVKFYLKDEDLKGYIKILFDREKNREIERKKEELTKYLAKEVERKRQYILEKYSKNGGLVFGDEHCMPYIYFVFAKDLKPKYRYAESKFSKGQYYRYVIRNSLKFRKFKVYLTERLNFRNEYISVTSKPFYIDIYDYKNLSEHLEWCGYLGELCSDDQNLQGNIRITLDNEKL